MSESPAHRRLLQEIDSLRSRIAELELEDAARREQSERRQRLLAMAVETVRQGVAITDARLDDPGPKLLYVNDFFCEMTGFEGDELVGESMRLMRDREPNQEALERMAEELRAGRPFRGELLNRRRDGSTYLVSDHVSPVMNAQGELTHLVSIQEDITESKRAENALRASEERHRLLIERMNEGFVATDRDNRVDIVNAKLVEMLGYSREEMRGRYLGRFVDGENSRWLEEQEERRHHGLEAPYELTFTAKDGSRVDTVISPTSLQDGEGGFGGSFAVVTDVTEKRKLEARVRQAQKMESLGLLAGGVAHDFNNLLVGILGHAGLALQELPPDSPARPLLQHIETAGLRASELTQGMLAYSGKGKLLVETLDLSRLVEEMVSLLEVTISKKATLKVECAADLPAFEGDATQIRQIVMNLITNASEALGAASGVLTVATGRLEADSDYLAETYLDDSLPEGRYVFLEVSDTGAGMDRQTRSRIFDPFFTTKFTGRGLGLAAVLGTVRGHRGAIKVYSEVDRGTSFRVLFPAVRDVAPGPQKPSAALAFRGEGCVLVVDDEEMVRSVARMTLEKAGFSVMTASDGVEAVETYRRHHQRLTAVLLDMTMPRMDGEEAYGEIRRIREDARIILSSGFNEEEAIGHFAAGPTAFLKKPFQPTDLLDKMRQVLAEPGC